jgi:glyoxylase-like metal-dependent hydrolase (beta-lactamase superfamily II)
MRIVAIASLTLCGVTSVAFAQPGADTDPMIEADAAMQVSEHVYVILDDGVSFVPNVGIVVGDRATLIVDTGLGEANGRIVLAAARKLSDNAEFYLTATHYHPEHDLGATAFPANAKMIRWDEQEQEVQTIGAETTARFAGFSPRLAELLDGAEFRAVDLLFDEELTVDLGGVRVRIVGVGPNHTLGDTVFFVEQDRVLFTGDVVMSVFPAASAASGSIAKWIANMDEFEEWNPAVVVPAHGRLGDMRFVRAYRDYFLAVQQGVRERKGQGMGADEIATSLSQTLAQQFAGLQPVSGDSSGRIGAAVRAAYREAE